MENKTYRPFSSEMTREYKIDSLYVKLNKIYNFRQELNLNPTVNDVFSAYLRAYHISTDEPEIADMLRSPEADIMRRLPGFRNMVTFFESREEQRKKITKKYFDEGNELAANNTMLLDRTPFAIKNMANFVAATYRKNEKLSVSEQKLQMQRLFERLKLSS